MKITTTTIIDDIIASIKIKDLDPNMDYNIVNEFFFTKNAYDYNHGKTFLNEWFYICYDLNDYRGDIPLNAYQFVHMDQFPQLQIDFLEAQERYPEIAQYMTFDIYYRIGKYIPYKRKENK